MARIPNEPVTDSVPKIDHDLAVGEDLKFQRRWWRFERITWMVFAAIIILDVLGVFGRGPVANASASIDQTMQIKYERIERYGTPSILRINFKSRAIRDGKIRLWVSESLVEQLGNQRIVPQPLESRVGDGGILYTFDAANEPASASFALQPSSVGMHELKLRLPGIAQLNLKVFVVP